MKIWNPIAAVTAVLLLTFNFASAQQPASGPAAGTAVKPGAQDTRTQDTTARPGGSPGVEGSAGTQSGESDAVDSSMHAKTLPPPASR
jgi:hypothetical protein